MSASRLALSYQRLASPLHATRASIGALWCASLLASALVLSHPLLLALLDLSIVLAGVASGLLRRLARTLRATLYLDISIVIVNVLVSREGITIFARLGDLGPFGQGDLSVEALLYGVVIALKVTAVTLGCALFAGAVDPDQLLAGARRATARSALTATLALRMIPLLAADSARFAQALQTRPQRLGRRRAQALILRATLTSALDRALEVAATLELRGAADQHPQAPRRLGDPLRRAPERLRGSPHRALSRHELAFLGSAGSLLALVAGAQLSGLDRYVAYPLAQAPIAAGTAAVGAGICALMLAPFADRRGIVPRSAGAAAGRRAVLSAAGEAR
ncbi:MAG TPA: energy-coupling factor transporter transmembrane component T [Solirubrobacteraceae bacterium]|nr:energy-coupling factor transporter transmembrane component T [Solirubrobacteraceae bacterium]